MTAVACDLRQALSLLHKSARQNKKKYQKRDQPHGNGTYTPRSLPLFAKYNQHPLIPTHLSSSSTPRLHSSTPWDPSRTTPRYTSVERPGKPIHQRILHPKWPLPRPKLNQKMIPSPTTSLTLTKTSRSASWGSPFCLETPTALLVVQAPPPNNHPRAPTIRPPHPAYRMNQWIPAFTRKPCIN